MLIQFEVIYMSEFYDGCKLMSLLDLDKEPPSIYLCCGNRTAGKTYFFKRMMLRNFVKKGEKFAVLVRFGYELKNCSDNFFKDLNGIDFPDDTMTDKEQIKGAYSSLYFNGKECGYVISINAADTIKKHSSVFVDVKRMFLDEFMSETGKYCPDEIRKFQSIVISISRGGGKHTRRVPVYMAANAVSIMNPYFVQFGIHKKITMDTKFMRGKGWVLEQTFNESAAESIKQTGIYKAFSDDKHMGYVTGDFYLLDNHNFVENLKGEKIPRITLTRNNQSYGLWEMVNSGLYLISHSYDPSIRSVYALDLDTHKNGTLLLTKGKFINALRQSFDRGQVWFEDMTCKNIFLDLIGLDINK